jgi:nucleoredoxin
MVLRICFALAWLLVAGVVHLSAQASDDPMAGLNLGNPDDLTGFPAQFHHHLVTVQDGHFQSLDSSTLKDVKFWAFYYSASWCPPCRAFTPKLVEFYNDFKAKHPNFELIFVNHDQNEDDMLAYMKGDAMTWPAVRFDDIESVQANKYCGPGIPDLVLVDSGGKVLSDSFNGQQYLGPEKVVDDIKSLVPTP